MLKSIEATISENNSILSNVHRISMLPLHTVVLVIEYLSDSGNWHFAVWGTPLSSLKATKTKHIPSIWWYLMLSNI